MKRIKFASWRVLLEPYYLNRYARQFHVLQVMLAFIAGLVLILVFSIPHGVWTLITILIVVSSVSHWGSVQRKARQRIAGSLLGAVAGLIGIVLYRYSPMLCYSWMILVMAVSTWYVSGKSEYMALLVGVTMVVVAGLGHEPVSIALWRTLNVVVGSVLGLVAAGLLPLRAIDSWRFLLADNLREAALLYSRIALRQPVHTNQILERLSARLVRMRGLMVAMVQESGLPVSEFESVQYRQRILISLLDWMGERVQTVSALHDGGGVQRQQIVLTLQKAARAMRFNRPDLLNQKLAKATSSLSDESLYYWLSAELAWVVERIREELAQLLPHLIYPRRPSSA